MFFPSKALSQWGRWKKQAGDERGQVEEKGKRGKGKKRKSEVRQDYQVERKSGRREKGSRKRHRQGKRADV